MKFIFAAIAWVLLAWPAIFVGKVWQSHAEPGPVVEVRFKDAPVTGHLLYKLDGSEWVANDGTLRMLQGTEVITFDTRSTRRAESTNSGWRGLAPLAVLSLVILLTCVASKRLEKK
jgi:hypothetical protein